MPTKVDPSTLQVGNGQLAQGTVNVSALDFGGMFDAIAAINGHIHNPVGAHKASAISTSNLEQKYDSFDVQDSLTELEDLLPDSPNKLGINKAGIPNSGIPSWGTLDYGAGEGNSPQKGGFTCITSGHKHASWGGSTHGSTTGWMVESHWLIPYGLVPGHDITSFTIDGILYPADRGVLVLLYSSTGNFNNSDEVVLAKLDIFGQFDQNVRRTAPYQQADYTASESGTDKVSLTYRLPYLRSYAAYPGAPYFGYSYDFLQYQLAQFTISAIDISAYADDMGSFRLIHFKQFTTVGSADYSAANIYGVSNRLDIFRDTNPGIVTANAISFTPAYPTGLEIGAILASPSLLGTNTLTISSPAFTLGLTDVGKVITVTGSIHNNNGDYTILKVLGTSSVKVSPNWTYVPESGGSLVVTFQGASLTPLSGVVHYGDNSGYRLQANLNPTGPTSLSIFTNSWLTGTTAVTNEVSSGYESDRNPLSTDLSGVGAANVEAAYYQFDNNGDLGPFDLTIGHAPSGSSPAGYILPVEATADILSSDAYASVQVKSPFSHIQFNARPTAISQILLDTYAQTNISKDTENFVSEYYRKRASTLGFSNMRDASYSGINGIVVAGADNIYRINTIVTLNVSDLVNKVITVSNASDPFNNGHHFIISAIGSGINQYDLITYPDSPITPGSTFNWSIDYNWDPWTPLYVDASAHSYGIYDPAELQVVNGTLVYPQIDYYTSSNYYPLLTISSIGGYPKQPNYSVCLSGDAPNHIRWHTRVFSTSNPKNYGVLQISGVTPDAMAVSGPFIDFTDASLAATHLGGVIVLVKTTGGWLDLGRYEGDPNLDKTVDGTGCLISKAGLGTDWAYEFNTDLYNTVSNPTTFDPGGDYILIVKIGFIKNGTGENKAISLVKYNP